MVRLTIDNKKTYILFKFISLELSKAANFFCNFSLRLMKQLFFIVFYHLKENLLKLENDNENLFYLFSLQVLF